MKLIDILNKIANGELKEGTKVIWDFKEYIYDGQYELWRSERGLYHCDILEEICLGNLLEEVELIEPNHSPDVGKMAEPTDNTKIEEVSAWGRTTFEYGSPVPAVWVMANKLNEVIRYINKGAEE